MDANTTNKTTTLQLGLIEKENKKNQHKSILLSILYYGLIVLIIIGAFMFSKSESVTKSIFGYRPYAILTPSMKSVYPVGSLVVVKIMPPQELEIGDDITFYYPDNPARPIWTHRIIEILPDYHGYGISFRTQGTDNREPDPFVTLGGNVVGKVYFCIPYAGVLATFVTDHAFIALGFLAFLTLFLLMIGDLLRKEPIIPRFGFGMDKFLLMEQEREQKAKEKEKAKELKRLERKNKSFRKNKGETNGNN